MEERKRIAKERNKVEKADLPAEEHHVYIEWYLDGRAGGPPGYLANLLSGLNRIDHYDKPLIVFNTYKGKKPLQPTAHKKIGIAEVAKKAIGVFPGGKHFYAKYISRFQKDSYKSMYNFLHDLDAIMPDQNLTNEIDWTRTKTIHVHTAAEVVKIKNYLRAQFLDNVKVVLTCHTPESCANEQYALSIASGQDETRARKIQAMWLELEKRAYREADIMIFPSKEAMEPLLHDIEGFSDIIAHKDIRYMATGSKKLTSSLTREEAKKKYGVLGKTVIGYIGRHNSIKGYDLLKDAAEIVLDQAQNAVFLIGGSQGKEYEPLHDAHWVEIGWVNPADMLQAVDVFVLPNRQTYYDLVLLEVLSMGVPVVATATGGNKSVKKIARDIELCDVNAESIADGILNVIRLTPSEREKMGCRIQETYQNYFTETHMAQRYIDTVCKIYDDYDLWSKEEDAND